MSSSSSSHLLLSRYSRRHQYLRFLFNETCSTNKLKEINTNFHLLNEKMENWCASYDIICLAILQFVFDQFFKPAAVHLHLTEKLNYELNPYKLSTAAIQDESDAYFRNDHFKLHVVIEQCSFCLDFQSLSLSVATIQIYSY